jgi:glycine/D-amino acid oxidase-like deaminating enzyme
MASPRRTASGVPPVSPRSWWLDEALRADPGAPCPPLVGDVGADVCVVGGGFAGLWTAYELGERDPALDVVVLEADICGAGGSGANGGFFSPSWTGLSSLCSALGEEGGVAYAAALAAMVDELDGWIAGHDARIDAKHEGILYARAGDWQPGPDDETFRLLEKHGYADRLRRVDAAEARRVADSPRFIGGVITPDLTVIQPGKLARELRRVLLQRGVRIFEGTPMTRVEAGRPLRVVTPAGAVTADGVVLTQGAWAARERHFRRAFAVCTDFMVVTEPIPDLIDRLGWRSHMGVADLREMLYYLRRTADDRIAIGGGAMGIVRGARIRGRVMTAPRLAAAAAHGLTWLFPQLEGVRFDAAWSGPMDITARALPFFESAPGGNVHAGLGFSGHGLTGTKLGGKILASLVLRADDEWSHMPVVGPPLMQLPPEPVRWPLLRSVTWAYEAGDRAHEQGRRPGLLPSTVIAGYGRYGALNGATGQERAARVATQGLAQGAAGSPRARPATPDHDA